MIKKLKNEKVVLGIKILIILVGIILLIRFFPITFSKYQTNAESNSVINYAFYVIEANYYKEEIMLDSIVPSNDNYICNFSVSNFNEEKQTDTNLEYDLWISTTTNLPLDYELLLNNEDAVLSDEIITDRDGTYFREIRTNKQTFNYNEQKTNNYSLIVHFPIEYKDSKYQDIIDSVTINIESRQIVD